MVQWVPGLPVGTNPEQGVAQSNLPTLDAMVSLAQHTGLAVHVVLPREPGVIEHAREAARRAGLDVSADLMPFTVRVRFVAPGGRAGR